MFEVNLPKEQLGNLQPMLSDLQSYKEEAIQNVAKTWYDFLQAFEGPNFVFGFKDIVFLREDLNSIERAIAPDPAQYVLASLLRNKIKTLDSVIILHEREMLADALNVVGNSASYERNAYLDEMQAVPALQDVLKAIMILSSNQKLDLDKIKLAEEVIDRAAACSIEEVLACENEINKLSRVKKTGEYEDFRAHAVSRAKGWQIQVGNDAWIKKAVESTLWDAISQNEEPLIKAAISEMLLIAIGSQDNPVAKTSVCLIEIANQTSKYNQIVSSRIAKALQEVCEEIYQKASF